MYMSYVLDFLMRQDDAGNFVYHHAILLHFLLFFSKILFAFIIVFERIKHHLHSQFYFSSSSQIRCFNSDASILRYPFVRICFDNQIEVSDNDLMNMKHL